MLDEVCAEGKQTESREKMVKRWIGGEFVERGDKKKGRRWSWWAGISCIVGD